MVKGWGRVLESPCPSVRNTNFMDSSHAQSLHSVIMSFDLAVVTFEPATFMIVPTTSLNLLSKFHLGCAE